MRQVYVRGVGAITPFGNSWQQAAKRLAKGDSAVAPVVTFDVTDFPCQVAAQVPHAFPERPDRRLAFAQIAAREAWAMAGFSRPPAAERLGVFVGAESGRATMDAILTLVRSGGPGPRLDHEAFGEDARDLIHRIDAAAVSPATVASWLAGNYEANGPVQTFSLACASSAAAIVEAVRAIRLGVIDTAICGGVGADVDPLMLVGFGKLAALSAKGVSRPFDSRRDGFVVGEGGAMIVLSSEPGDARARITGVGRSLDGYHLTKPHPEGAGARRAMTTALRDAGEPRIDYVQAHGTSTLLNDAVEATIIDELCANRPWVSSLKGALGHWVAGAGAIGFIGAWHAVVSGECLPTAGLEMPDEACAVRHVIGKAQAAEVSAALVNAFAFGGANASVIVEAR